MRQFLLLISLAMCGIVIPSTNACSYKIEVTRASGTYNRGAHEHQSGAFGWYYKEDGLINGKVYYKGFWGYNCIWWHHDGDWWIGNCNSLGKSYGYAYIASYAK